MHGGYLVCGFFFVLFFFAFRKIRIIIKDLLSTCIKIIGRN